MEIRKLQLIGGSSYMVSLPKSWITANSLRKGDELVLHVDTNHIRIHPKKCSSVSKGHVKLPRCDFSFLKRFMHSLYVQGLDEIIVEGDFNQGFITRMSDIARNLIGMEIIDAKPNKVTLKCIAEVELVDVLNRLSQIVSTMFQLLETGIKKNNPRELLEVTKLERDADRLYMLAVRQENKLLKELSCPSKWSDLRFVLGTRVVSKHLEDIADLLYSFSIKVSASPSAFSSFVPILVEAKRVFERAYAAYTGSDVLMAEDAINAAEQLQKVASGELLCVSMLVRGVGEVAFNKAVRESASED
ncbi:phosphate signaling complex PhoU family protein [Archaeoglobus veneficus]|uniref:Phosphate uptake regulator, PhoU n=1 Tax=Archaeoglobus veneficus (strain DSM 11195 / SNP6) TaxID=693661 RepID=F2KQ71_ARCVS|nr:phosphate uptake regulator PhoU [Archaeoglobus veneficus]AEA47674.1 phosphate uptake regulator, PhoU [Archaeoglobus veneficus SNP6]